MFRTARASRKGRPPESRSTTFPTTLIQTQSPSWRRTRYSAWWSGTRPARQPARDAAPAGRSSGWIAASQASRRGGVTYSAAGFRRLRPTGQGRSRPSRSPARRGTGLLTGGPCPGSRTGPDSANCWGESWTDCFVPDWYNDQRNFRILQLRGGSRLMATLLLIDDDPDLLRDRVSHVFPAPAHRVEIAQTAAEGLKRVAAAYPDVILLDLRLPDQSGLDILRQLRRIDARIPVVMVTVARSSDSAIEAMRQGAYDYLLKPI